MNTKRFLSTLMIHIVTLSLLLSACAPATPAKDLSDPLTLVTEYYAAIEAGEIPKAMEFVSDNYVMTDPTGFTVGREAATAAWNGYIDAGFTFDQSNFEAAGNRVTSCYKVYEKGKLIDEGCGAMTHVRDGKIIFDGLEPAEQIWIVQEFYEAFNANEIERGMSLTAEDYVMNDPFGTYDRAAAAIQWQAVRAAGITFNQTNFQNAGDGRVTSCYDVLENGNSVDKGCGNVTRVRDGKIIYDGLENAEQIWVVQKYYEALNAKKLDLAMSFIALDALFINPTGTYEGADAIRESLAGLNTDGITFDLSNFRNANGRVVYDYKVVQGANLLDQGTNGLTIVKDGKVVFDGTEDTDPLAAAADPAAVVQEFWAAMKAGDVDAAMAFVADDAKCKGSCYFTGKQSFQAYLQGYINSGTVTELGELTVEGDTVRYPFKEYRNGLLMNNSTPESMQIKDGKIIFWENFHW